MMGSFLTRGLVMVFGYAYPAYECFKTVEKNKPEIEQLRFWCQYWILVAVLTVFERVGDTFISWVPMYSEAKLAFFIYLWYPKTKGTAYVYDSFFRPYLAKHETEIDRNLLELRTRAGDIAILYWQRAASYGQTRVFEILQYVAAQSTARPRPSQQQQGTGVRQILPTAPTRQNSVNKQQPQQSLSHTSSVATSASSEEQNEPAAEEVAPPQAPSAPPAAVRPQTAAATEPSGEISAQATKNEAEATQIVPVQSSSNGNSKPQLQEKVMDDAIRVTRARLRKTRAAANR
ncbi:putative HVA22-like protein g isoform X2 [Macadamia integrifolia]|uniref:putative HVA22-like protein g isoform X2 n=1 Tax=Macadamia integrifolia TaxID=60698 RepID=UPI001C5005D1|nr:putative HVA22-like protein g isoform X2 [Macadamia integrifolia]